MRDNPGSESLTDERVAALLHKAKRVRDKSGGNGEMSICSCWAVSDVSIDELIQLLEIYEIAHL